MMYSRLGCCNTVRIFLSIDTIIDAPVYKEMNNDALNNGGNEILADPNC